MAFRVIASAVLLVSGLELRWAPCEGSDAYAATLLDLQPTVLAPGAVTKMKAKVMMHRNITDGVFKFEAHFAHWFGRRRIVEEENEGDVCNATKFKFADGMMGALIFWGVDCPQASGLAELDVHVAVVKAARFATVDVELSAVSDTGEPLLCVRIETGAEWRRQLPILPTAIVGSILAALVLCCVYGCLRWRWRRLKADGKKHGKGEADAMSEAPLGKVAVLDDNASTVAPSDLEMISQVCPTEAETAF